MDNTIFVGIDEPFEMKKIIRFRGIIANIKVDDKIKEMDEYIRKHNLKPIGQVVTAVHDIKQEGTMSKFDVEILIPINDVIDSSTEFIFLDSFRLEDVIMVRCNSLYTDQNIIVEKVKSFLASNNLSLTTPGYNVITKHADQDYLIVTAYFGYCART